jgi:superfamily II DNA/RNA helicase
MFIPQAVKECYLVYLLRQLIEPEDEDGSGGGADDSDDGEDAGADAAGVRRRAKLKQQRAAAEQAAKTRKGMAGGGGGGGSRKGGDSARQQSFDDQIKQAQAGPRKPKSSAIIFVSTCKSCQILSEILLELEIPCVALHSQINQARRMAALGKFRAGQVRVLIATDVASRGLDIPSVQLVVNYDVPRVSADYVHRVGRTARAGRAGQAITLVTQYDLEVFAEVEALLGRKLTEKTGVAEADALASLRTVAAAKRMAAIRLESYALRTKQSLKRDGDEKQRRQAQKEKRTASASAAVEVNVMGRGSDGRGPRGDGTAASVALGGKRKNAESSAASFVSATGSKRAKPAAAAAP